MATILHISDLHFSAPGDRTDHKQLIAAILSAIPKKRGEIILVASGDFTYKGQVSGFEEGSRFLKKLIRTLKITPAQVLLCPGNHDLNNSAPTNVLGDYRRFASDVMGGPSCSFDGSPAKTIELKICGDTEFWIFNTVYKMNHAYGYVDIPSARRLSALKHSDHMKVGVMHHHLINQHQKDTSSIRNAYEVLKFLDENKFKLLLHGHQHSQQTLSAGNNVVTCLGIRSLNFKGDAGVRGFTLIEIQDDGACRHTEYILEFSGETMISRKIAD